MKPGVQRNQLTQKEFFAVCKWLEENAASFDGHPYTRVAARANEQLPFKVTEANIAAACDATGVTWNRTPKSGAPRKTSQILAADIVRICDALGMAASEDTYAILNHRRRSGEAA